MSCAPARSAQKWGNSGLAYLTGLPDGPPDFSRANVLSRAERITADAASLLAGRAGLLGLTRGGRVSAGGASRLLQARDGWCAITLSRPDDIAAVPALLQVDDILADPWPDLKAWATTRLVSEIVERAGLLDIPAAALGEAAPASPRICRMDDPVPGRGLAGLLVADLSSMWAGPLCGKLLARAGATVVKVESRRRPDGTRAGNRAFFDWINSEKLSYCLDFDSQADDLRHLLTVADVVIEGSRPAALARRRLGPEDISPLAGRIWVQITGYDDSGRPAFGDDAAVAGGLVGTSVDGPVFCGDAIADPLTGLEATLVVTESLCRGGGELVQVAMAAVAASYAESPAAPSDLGLPGPTTAASGSDAGQHPSWAPTTTRCVALVAERRCLSC